MCAVRKSLIRAFLGLALAAAAGAVHAATCTAAAGTNNWGAAATWNCGHVPVSGDNVVIPNGATVVLDVNTNRLSDLNVNAGGVLRGDNTGNTLTINNGAGADITNDGTIDFGEGNLATIFTRQSTTWAGAGTWNLSVIDLNGNTLGFSFGSSMTINMSGDAAPIVNAGTLTSLAAMTWNFTGTVAQTLPTSTNVHYGNLTVSNTTGVTLGVALTSTNILGDLTVASNGIFNNGGFAITLASGKNFAAQSGATFNLTGTSTMVTVSGGGTKTFNAASTVNYGGTNQAVTAETYGNLALSGSGTKTIAAGTTTIAGGLTLAAGVTYNGTTNNPTVNLAGDFTHSGTFNSGTGTFTFNGATAQTLSGSSASTTFTRLQLDNASGLTLGHNVTVSTLLTLTSGVVSTGANTLITSANCPASISRTSGHVAGSLQLRFATGAQTCTFHVGDAAAANYTPVSVSLANVSVAGSLIGSTIASDYPDVSIPIDPAGSVNRYWTLTLPGAGALSFTGTYSTTFTYLSGDNDSTLIAGSYEVAKGDSCAPSCTWTLPTVSGTPTSTSATASGMTNFSVFAIGRRLNNFLITLPSSPADPCNAQGVTIRARDHNNNTITNYQGSIGITVSSNHGNWGKNTAQGTFTAGAPDSGSATYVFVAADSGVINLSYTNTHSDTLTVSVTDTAAGVTTTTLSSVTFTGNAFVITSDAVQVAGRGQAMSVKLIVGSSCNTTNTLYPDTNPKSLKAWLTLDASDPGGAVPSIGGVALSTNSASPSTVSLSFASGIANFTLATTDIGKYVLNLRDDSRTFATGADINGSSSTITTRPFALVVRDIKQGATLNPGGTATAGSKFIAAADSFQATVASYQWNAAADGDNDGVPDAGATFANITGAGLTPSYRWATTLSVDGSAPFTPATGARGTLSNGSFIAGDFSGGSATKSTLSYSEVGSFTLAGTATNFLNSGFDLTAIVFDNSAPPVRGAVIGRFFPDHFTLTSGAVSTACGGFVYMDQPALALSFAIEARNKSDNKTSNYTSGYTTGAVTMPVEDGTTATDLGARVPLPAASWTAGTYSVSTATATFTRGGSPDGPFDSLYFSVGASDPDGATISSPDFKLGDPVCTTSCTHRKISASTMRARFGRLFVGNTYGSEKLTLALPVETQYWAGSYYQRNTLDACTSLATANIALGNYTNGLGSNFDISHVTGVSPISSGLGTITLSKPNNGATGSVDLAINLGSAAAADVCPVWANGSTNATATNFAYLQSNWCGATFAKDPDARIDFGVTRNRFIFRRENY